MSLQYSNPTLKSGIVELIRKNCKTNSASHSIEEITADVNLTIDDAVELAIKTSGKWQWDDNNHEDYPIIYTDLVINQRDYPFTEDEEGNIILDIYKVFAKNPDSGEYYELKPVDMQSDEQMEVKSFNDELNTTGRVQKYDKTGNAVFMDVLPDQTITDGLKILINREGSYFLKTDTTKKPGFPGTLHEYFVWRPSYRYAIRNGLKNKNDLEKEMLKMEAKFERVFGQREKDVRPVLRAKRTPFR